MKPFSDLDSQLGLSGAGSSQNHHQWRDHRSPQSTLHATSGRRHDAASSTPSWRLRACALDLEMSGGFCYLATGYRCRGNGDVKRISCYGDKCNYYRLALLMWITLSDWFQELHLLSNRLQTSSVKEFSVWRTLLLHWWTHQIDDNIVWHELRRQDFQRISYCCYGNWELQQPAEMFVVMAKMPGWVTLETAQNKLWMGRGRCVSTHTGGFNGRQMKGIQLIHWVSNETLDVKCS